jgi:hypothetical protein
MLMGIKGYKIILSIVLSFLVFPLNINATQRVWPGIVNDTVIISDTTSIEHGPLILPPGTHLIFRKNSTLLSKVPVKAIGTYDNPIIFNRGGGGTSPEWNSFSIECQNTDSVVFKYCRFEYGDNPLIINQIGNVYIQDCFFYKFNSIGITCNKLSNKLVVENCYFYGLDSFPIVKLIETDTGASTFINKNALLNEQIYVNDSINSDTVANIYYTDNFYCWHCSDNEISKNLYQSGIGPAYSTFYFTHELRIINRLNYSSNNKFKSGIHSQSVSIDGRVLTGQTSSRLVILNKTKKSFSGKYFGKSFN